MLRPNATPEERRRGMARRIPHLLLTEVLARATRIEAAGENVVNAPVAVTVTIPRGAFCEL